MLLLRRRFTSRPAGLVGVPAVITDQVRTLGRNMLGKFGQEIQRRENLEVPLRARLKKVPLRVGEGAAGVLLGPVDHLAALRPLGGINRSLALWAGGRKYPVARALGW